MRDCTIEIPKLLRQGIKNHIIVVDPPRKGCDNAVLDAILKSEPHKIIYVSCNPNTLARDIKILLQNNSYEIKEITPFDMFPHTAHVESVVCLTRKWAILTLKWAFSAFWACFLDKRLFFFVFWQFCGQGQMWFSTYGQKSKYSSLRKHIEGKRLFLP